MRDTQGVNVDAIDTILTDLAVTEENFLNTFWELSNSSACRHEPAITKFSLDDILGRDTAGAEKSEFIAW